MTRGRSRGRRPARCAADRAALLRPRPHRPRQAADAGRGDLDGRHGLRPRRHRQPRRGRRPASACGPPWPRSSATTSTAPTARRSSPARRASTSRSPASADGWHTPVTVALAHGDDRALVTHGQEPPYSQDALMGDPPEPRTALVHLEAEPRAWLAKAAANGTLIFADVGWDPTQQWSTDLLDQLALCHAFLPNETEAMAYTRTDSAVAALARSPSWCRSPWSPGAGTARSPSTRRPASTRTSRPSTVDVLDATGAGDVFGASFVAASLGGWPLAERLRFAVLAAALSVQHHGGALAAPGWYGVDRWWRALRRPRAEAGVRLPGRPHPGGRRPPVRYAPVTPPARGPDRARPNAPTCPSTDPSAKYRTDPKGGGSCAALTRGLLRAGLAGTAATALGGLASGCAVPTGSTGREHGPVVLERRAERHGRRRTPGPATAARSTSRPSRSAATSSPS